MNDTNILASDRTSKSFVGLEISDSDEIVNNTSAADRTSNKTRFEVISLFSGCGGMDLGFLGGFTVLGRRYSRHPFKLIWANELNEAACKTYRKNIGSHIRQGDIWMKLDDLPAEADIVIGGFPCQDISINGKGAGIQGHRSGLYRAMVEAVARVKPKIFIAENVKGLLMKPHAKALQQVLKDFEALGYDVSFKLYHAADYGVPQTRERVIIIGTLPGVKPFKHPNPTVEIKDHITVKKALHDLVALSEDESINHIWSRANRSPDQGDRRLVADRPGYTIRAECHGNIQWHYELPRRISMREAARIQSFPDNFIFDAKLRETERQIGNAVPPVLAWHIAKAVTESLK
ncbi:MAG: DNA cytosine methyltransferase [Nitrosomonas sp.]|nr:DNA cytosine methyltransferase [Nitrosomonas sp.]